MIKSMTGYGRSEFVDGARKISVEMKSVNHRYFETNIKIPKKLNVFESRIREVIKKYANRGKIDVFITYDDMSENKVLLKYNKDVADEYVKIFKQISDDYGMTNDMTVSGLSRFPDVITMEEESDDEEELWAFIENAVTAACVQFVDARIAEGANLKRDLTDKLGNMAELVSFIEERSPLIVNNYKTKLENKMKEVLANTSIDESRIASEVIIYADKICVDEETVRLRSHIDSALKNLSLDGEIGKKMDFMAQEMNREANTILSKANDTQITNKAIDLKTEIEKVREQIQNIE